MPISVKRYTSDMTGALALTGQAGSLVTMLDSILVSGFNEKTVTLAQTMGTATATCNSHGYQVNDVVVISGANESVWNDEFRVLTAATNTFTFAIAETAASPATGDINAKIAPLGWTKPYSGTNKAVYLPKIPFSQCYLRILDDSSTPTSANGRWAKVRGYVNMSDVDTGTEPFPTVAQSPNGCTIMKSTTSDGVSQSWWVVGDSGIFYIGIFSNPNYPMTAACHCFGDAGSLITGDAYCYLFVSNANWTSDIYQQYPGDITQFAVLSGAWNGTQLGKQWARSYNPLTEGPVLAGFLGSAECTGSKIGYVNATGFPYPNPAGNAILFVPIAVNEPTSLRSPRLPGVYQPLHAAPFTYLDIFDNLSELPGRTLQVFNMGYNSYMICQILIDITGPWR